MTKKYNLKRKINTLLLAIIGLAYVGCSDATGSTNSGNQLSSDLTEQLGNVSIIEYTINGVEEGGTLTAFSNMQELNYSITVSNAYTNSLTFDITYRQTVNDRFTMGTATTEGRIPEGRGLSLPPFKPGYQVSSITIGMNSITNITTTINNANDLFTNATYNQHLYLTTCILVLFKFQDCASVITTPSSN